MNSESIKERKNEKGAAMVTVLMVTLILLVASAGLLLESTMNTANVTDAIAEEQAYVAAESGIQSAINVLRGNRDTYMNSNLLDSSKTSSDPANLINYIRALKTSSSNASGDDSAVPRLSRWIKYDTTYTDRVVIGKGSEYNPRTGNAFELELMDPDLTGDNVTFSTTGTVGGTTNSTVTYGSGANTVTFTYTPRSSTTLTIPGESIASNIGNISISVTGTGATLTDDVKFAVLYKMTDPYESKRLIRGYFKLPRDASGNSIATTVNSSNIGTSGIKLYYNSMLYQVMGSVVTITGGSVINDPIGYELTPSYNNTMNCTIAPAEPIRLSIKATGYGPRGSKKTLEAIIQKNFFNGMTAPATLTMVGSSTDFVFNPGNSNVVVYSGDDVASYVMIPPVGTTNDPNLYWVETQFTTGEGWKANVYGDPANVNDELPEWLWSPAALDATIVNLRQASQASGNYYNSGEGPNAPGNYATGKGITFIDGDYTIRADGGGLLVVTGKLTLHGAFAFKGLIIVTGADGMDRRGGGNGVIQGNVVLAPYTPSNLSLPFLSPKYDMSGGGTSDLRYDSNSVANGMTAVSNFVIGVAEK